MNSFLYFAYGSNMLTRRLKARCPSARPLGPARAPGHGLNFTKRGKDGSGKATLFAHPEHCQPGVLFEINRNDQEALDRAEGAGHGYERVDAFPVIRPRGCAEIPVTTYLGLTLDERLKPFDWYLALVVAGAKEHGLPDKQITLMQLTPYVMDTETNRQGRREALDALNGAGAADIRAILAAR